MAIGSILLAVLAFGCAVLGVLTTPFPGVGAAFSFSAPAFAIAGAIVGGIGMSRARQEGRSTDSARMGVILSAVAFVPALLTAMFCGVCNALCATGNVHIQRSVRVGVDPNAGVHSTAGARALPPPAFAGAAAPQPTAASVPGAAAPAQAPSAPAAADRTSASPTPAPSTGRAQPAPAVPPTPPAAPALPPPPLPAGPKQGR